MSDAKLHHYVPQFLLRRFSTDPEADTPRLWRLDKATGKTERRPVRSEAAVAGYNDLLEAKDIPKGYAEHTLSLVEGEAAKSSAKWWKAGRSIPPSASQWRCSSTCSTTAPREGGSGLCTPSSRRTRSKRCVVSSTRARSRNSIVYAARRSPSRRPSAAVVSGRISSTRESWS
jgi:Protein of unknown function (DUF4238)